MPPRGVKSAKRKRQYEHIKESAMKSGRSTRRAKQIAAATVNKERREAGETKTRSRKSSSRKRSTTGARKRSTAASRKRSAGSRKRSSAAKKR